MFFYLSKLLWALVVPSTFLVLVAAGGLVLSRWRRRAGIMLAAAGVAGLLVGSLMPVGRGLLLPLEDRFPAFADDGRAVDGVIVLGGAEVPDIAAARGQFAFQEAGERIMALANLARRYPQARIVFSGGSSALRAEGENTESDTVRQALPALGIPPDRVLFEGHSRNTAENARLSKALVQPKPGERWLLVTSAYHMPRAVGCFRAAGFEVTAYPVDFRTTGADGLWKPYRSVADGLADLDIGVREWLGLLVYYLSGRTDALWPAP